MLTCVILLPVFYVKMLCGKELIVTFHLQPTAWTRRRTRWLPSTIWVAEPSISPYSKYRRVKLTDLKSFSFNFRPTYDLSKGLITKNILTFGKLADGLVLSRWNVLSSVPRSVWGEVHQWQHLPWRRGFRQCHGQLSGWRVQEGSGPRLGQGGQNNYVIWWLVFLQMFKEVSTGYICFKVI